MTRNLKLHILYSKFIPCILDHALAKFQESPDGDLPPPFTLTPNTTTTSWVKYSSWQDSWSTQKPQNLFPPAQSSVYLAIHRKRKFPKKREDKFPVLTFTEISHHSSEEGRNTWQAKWWRTPRMTFLFSLSSMLSSSYLYLWGITS